METKLDMICAEYGNKIVAEIHAPGEKNKIESVIIKSLGVLQEDGVYAFALYTKSKSGEDSTEKRATRLLFEKSYEFLKDERIAMLTGDTSDFLEHIRTELADNLDRLLFAKELIERTLVYARYHAKALEA